MPKQAKPGLIKVTDFEGQLVSFRPGLMARIETRFDKDEKPTLYIEGDLLDEGGTYYPNVRVFQAGLIAQLRSEMGEWIGGRLITVDTGKGNPMFTLDGSAMTPKLAGQFSEWEAAAPPFNNEDEPF